MQLALSLAEQGNGRTMPNPSVGAVVVAQDGKTIVGVGRTQDGGRPHAEPVALKMAGEAAHNATLYVTLEPCSHTGKSPPCVDAVIVSGVGKVVCALGDPDERVSGNGFNILRQAGIEVITGVMEDEAKRITAGHLTRVQKQRPYVVVKIAVSQEGKVASGDGQKPVWVTGLLARQRGHLARARSDAILVGIGTVLADDPMLDCRLPGLTSRSPWRIVLDSKGRLPAQSQLVQTSFRSPILHVTTRKHPAWPTEEAAGVENFVIQGNKNDQIDLTELLKHLSKVGVTRLLVEGGPTVAGSFIHAGLADEVMVFQGPDKLGEDGLPAFGNDPLTLVTKNDAFAKISSQQLGNDKLTIYKNRTN